MSINIQQTYSNIFCMKWVRQGIFSETTIKSSFQVCLEPNKEERKEIQPDSESEDDNQSSSPSSPKAETENSTKTSDMSENGLDSDDEIIKKFNLDNYDNEDDLTSKWGQEIFQNDNYAIDEPSDEEEAERENLNIQPTDNLIVLSKAEDPYNNLEVHVYNPVTGDFYCHHDVFLDQTPISMAILTNELSTFVLIGLPDGQIEAWDLNVVNAAEPDLRLKAHSDAVLDIQTFPYDGNTSSSIFMSSSIDKSVSLWKIPTIDPEKIEEDQDLSLLKLQDLKIKGKVQTMAINSEINIIAFGTMNGTVRTHRIDPDTFEITEKKRCIFENFLKNPDEEIERVKWYQKDTLILATSSLGNLCVFNEEKKQHLTTFQIHSKAIPHIIPCFEETGIFTCSPDGFIKLWKVDLSNSTPVTLVKKKKFGEISEIYVIDLNPDTESAISVGGKKGGLQIWNLRNDADVLETFGKHVIAKVETDQVESEKDKNRDTEYNEYVFNASSEAKIKRQKLDESK